MVCPKRALEAIKSIISILFAHSPKLKNVWHFKSSLTRHLKFKFLYKNMQIICTKINGCCHFMQFIFEHTRASNKMQSKFQRLQMEEEKSEHNKSEKIRKEMRGRHATWKLLQFEHENRVIVICLTFSPSLSLSLRFLSLFINSGCLAILLYISNKNE